MEPASKVSVPLTVVMRTRSRVPPSASEPLLSVLTPELPEVLFVDNQVFPVSKVITITPLYKVAALTPDLTIKPEVAVAMEVALVPSMFPI